MKRFLLLLVIPFFCYGASWVNGATFYQIFPLSFYDADGDGKGDLKGIAQKMDYLTNLGITAIWLNPIFLAKDYHGYNTLDYYQIDPRLGTMEDFDLMIQEAHKRGVKVILDFVINHTSVLHPWFVDGATNKNSPYTNYYVWSKTKLSWPNPTGSTTQPAWNLYNNSNSWRNGQYYYAAFNLNIPDLNLTDPKVVEEVKKIVKFWMDKGVDGFRLDAARYYIEKGEGEQTDTPETIAFIDKLVRYIKSINPEAYVVAEVFAPMEVCASYYKGEGGLDAVFNFDFGGTGDRAIYPFLLTGRSGSLRTALEKYTALAKKNVPFTFFALFLSNHDTGRLSEKVKQVPKQKLAAVLQFTLPGGAPYVYYGDEIGQLHGSKKSRGGGDSEKRYPLWWSDEPTTGGFSPGGKSWVVVMQPEYYVTNNMNVAAYQKDKQSLWYVYQKLIAMRKKYPALQIGSFVDLPFEQAKEKGLDSVLTYGRVTDKQVALVLINGSASPVELKEALNLSALSTGKWKYVDGISSVDLTKPVPSDVVQGVLKGQWNVKLVGTDFYVMIFEKVQ
jgi:glycosidase